MGRGEWLPQVDGVEYSIALERDDEGKAVWVVHRLDTEALVCRFRVKRVEIEEIP